MAESSQDAIVCCCTANWLPAAAVTLLSCWKHGLSGKVDLIVLCSGASDDDRTALETFNRHHGTAIQLFDIEPEPPAHIDFRHWGVTILLKLTPDHHLAASYRRVLLLDADVLALSSVAPLLAVDLQGNVLGAVDELLWLLARDGAARLSRLGLDPTAAYFNSGVTLFDWQATLASGLLPRALQLLATGQWPYLDQDVMNIVVQNRWLAIDTRWNVTTRFDETVAIQPWIRHFTARPKPWMRGCRFADRHYKKLYSDALDGTPWQTFVDPDYQEWSVSVPLRVLQRRLNLGRSWHLVRHLRHHRRGPAAG